MDKNIVKWHPVDNGLPKESGLYIVTVLGTPRDKRVSNKRVRMVYFGNESTEFNLGTDQFYESQKVLAWAYPPEMYGGE